MQSQSPQQPGQQWYPQWPQQQQPMYYPSPQPSQEQNTGYPQWQESQQYSQRAYYPPQQQPQQYLQQPYYPPQQYPQYSPPKKKSRKTLWIVLGVIVAVVLFSCIGFSALAALGGHTATQQQPVQQVVTAQPTIRVTTAQQKPLSTVGKPVIVDDTWTVTVNSVSTNKGASFIVPKVGNIFLVVDVTVKNTSATKQGVSSLVQFALKDSTGQEYGEALTSTGHTPDGTLTPGSLLRGQLSYEVPLSQHAFTLQFQSDIVATDIAEWSLRV